MIKVRKTLKKLGVIAAGSALAMAALHSEKREAKAIPMFARRYGVACSTCHTSAPRLNETGYQFRAAGFRMPNEIGKPIENRPFKATDYVGFRLQPRLDLTRAKVGSNVDRNAKVNLFAAEGYLWYAPISKYFSSNLKVTFWPEESNETELTERVEGTMRFTYGNDKQFVDIRAGVPHPHEGFGGSEAYVVTDTRPFIHELQTANFNQDTFFTPDGFHQAGGSVGYYYKRTTIRAQVTTGIRVKVDEHGDLEPFGRKDPLTSAIPQSNRGGPDFNIFFNQILHHQAGNISVQYYNGRSYLPRLDLIPETPGATTSALAQARDLTSVARALNGGSVPTAIRAASLAQGTSALEATATPIDLSNIPFFRNDFHRLGFYAGYPIKRLNLLYGIQQGRDTIGSGGTFTSLGQFGEAMFRLVNDISVIGARFDWFDPARNKVQNHMTGITAYMNVWLHSELRVTPEYQHLIFKRGPGQLDRVDDKFQLRLYWVK